MFEGRVGAIVSLTPDLSGAFDRSMQHQLRTDLFKGGVYDPHEAVETHSHAKERHLEPMEVRADHA